jgi:hypothetical protein
MKNIKFLFYSLLMLGLGACGSSKSIGINQVDDDVYWSRKDEPKTGQNYKDIEKWNKNKGPNTGSSEATYVPTSENTSAGLQDQTAVNADELRAQEAYQAWEKSLCDGLIFDVNRFLDSPSFSVEEVQLGDERVLLVAPC